MNMSAISDTVRKMFSEGDAKRDAGLEIPEDIVRFTDIPYGDDAKWQILDIYRPKETEGKLPVIISVHGGGWVYGDKEVYRFYCMSLAQRGFAVVNFTYRLAPEHKFPAPLEDTNSVCRFVMEHQDEYGLDTDHIFAVGDSAGAHILSLYAAILTNAEYASEYSFKTPAGFRLKAIALNCGAFIIDTSKNDLTTQLMNDFLPEGGSEKEIRMVSGANHIREGYPPVFLMTSTGDFLKEQPQLVIPVLIRNDIPFVLHYYGTKENSLPHVFHCNMRLTEAKLCNDEECAFFRSYIEKN